MNYHQKSDIAGLFANNQLFIPSIPLIRTGFITGVPGVSLVVLLATLGTVGIALQGLVFIVGIDRTLDMARTVVNEIGNSLAATVMTKREGRFGGCKEKEYLAAIGKTSVNA